jgi:hypothetical protein
MGEFIGEYAKSGRFIDGAGLGRSATRTRLSFQNGKCMTQHGPYGGTHELPCAALLLKVRTRDEALGWAERYGKILGDGEIELGKVNEPWDIGLMPAPENPPLQMLLIDKADAASEAGGRSPQQKAALTRLETEMSKAGVLVRSFKLKPSSTAKRLLFRKNTPQITDGPFTESKEVILGFDILDCDSMEEAIEIASRHPMARAGRLELREFWPMD